MAYGFGIPPGGSDLFFILSREEQLVVIIGVMKPHMDEYTKFHQNLHKIMSKMVNSYVFDDFKRITCQFHPWLNMGNNTYVMLFVFLKTTSKQ